jgi:signal transduction histidine kinase
LICVVQEQLRALTTRLHELQEQERAELARELHDEFGSALTAIDLYSTMRQLPDKTNGVETKVKGMSDLIDDTLESLRRTAALLRPRLLDLVWWRPSSGNASNLSGEPEFGA